MSTKTKQKIHKALSVVFLVAAGIVLLFIVGAVWFFSQLGTPVSRTTTTVGSFGMMSSSDIRNGFMMDKSEGGLAISPSASNAAVELSPASDIVVERKLTQNGYLSLAVPKVEEAVISLSSMAEQLGGRVDSIQYYNNESTDKNATVILRVPSTNFQQGMTEAKKLALKVKSENITTTDVTNQFVDMQAKLKNLKLVETQYQELMKKAVKIDDILQVSEQLSQIRQQIDQVQGEMNYLSRQVDMSIITVSLSSDPEVQMKVLWNPETTAKEALQGFLTGFYSFLKVIIFLLLFLIPIFALWFIVLGGIAWIGWKVLKMIFKKISGTTGKRS